MTVSAKCLALLLSCGLVAGCFPPGSGTAEEEKETHFLAGKTRLSEMDYKGAAACFEKALEVNPRSASAHFELGWLYEKKEMFEPETAIYHWAHYLQLRPNAENGGLVRGRILSCKQALAASASGGPVTQSLQRENDHLTDLNQKLASDLERWSNHAIYLRGLTNGNANAQGSHVTQSAGGPPGIGAASAASNPAVRQPTPPSGAGHTHTVKSGETPTVIARKYGIKLEALMAANPRLDARRMQVGQSLVIPASP